MSYTDIATYVTIKGEKRYLKDNDNDYAMGLLKKSPFLKTSETELDKSYLQNNYEREIHDFVKKLFSEISAVGDEDGEISRYIFSDSESFDEKHLLWACFDLLIKADLTIEVIKQERMQLLKGNVCLKRELERR